jgi:fatty acid desaturase
MTDQPLRSRIDAMLARDRAMAWIFVALLWITIGFVYFATDQFITNGTLRAVLIVGALLILIFNTASMLAMIKHYEEDREHIYGLDIKHLDENRRA